MDIMWCYVLKMQVVCCLFIRSNFVLFIILGVFGGPVVSVLDCQPRGSELIFRPWQKFGSRFLLHLRPLANSAIMSALTVHCRWQDETVSERIGQLPSYAEGKKMKSLTLHTYGCFRAIA